MIRRCQRERIRLIKDNIDRRRGPIFPIRNNLLMWGQNMEPQRSSRTTETVQTLKRKIDRLTVIQAKALKTATFGGMTAEEAKEYDTDARKFSSWLSASQCLRSHTDFTSSVAAFVLCASFRPLPV
jgi:hypothetical protein